MRRRGLVLLGLWACVLSGCLSGKQVPSTSWLAHGWPGEATESADVVVLDVFLCEATLGDTYIDQDLWKLADDQVISLEHKAVLEHNGFRVGQVGGVAPAGLQTLIASKKSCPDPRRIRQHCGKSTRISLGPVSPQSQFQLHSAERAEASELENAEFSLLVVPSPSSDGRTRLRFTPEVVHGKSAMLPTPSGDRSSWMFQKQQPGQEYASLSWDVTLAMNEHAIVGGRFERLDTLGRACFIRPDEKPPRQRLLIIRASRPTTAIAQDTFHLTNASTEKLSPPLALQAAWTTIRGVSP